MRKPISRCESVTVQAFSWNSGAASSVSFLLSVLSSGAFSGVTVPSSEEAVFFVSAGASEDTLSYIY